ncbi:hypothetical protein ASPWEDRAFT_172801 [Aspergillus wentii DTO 134E9]|uniref:Mid2 domain-containing protein n=1 Tax=Aspergillus wentii DTO 134E9 TaxID=1073089 RepID=A0A1L9RM43_ASPWE|nr:uncharacterized protein ASPWEDRAFT_172801 [Aspergillus wentii DTO 134E9]KAI9929543.1 hypothetical protein MW887_001016 [Aspergillus wentii]OJJ36015.1 hypothetical protein ASPWEDRAFT_172801 [Aspergillus wentii DTO 134E9]
MLSANLFALFVSAALAAGQTCYWPDKTVATGDVPCNSGTYSSCCSPNSICLDNGYCMAIAQPFTLYRSSCTDSGWGDSCPRQCYGTDSPQGSACSIVLLENTKQAGVWYCCNSIVANSSSSVGCFNDQAAFQLPDGDVVMDKALMASASCAADTISPTGGNSIAVSSSTSTSSASESTTSSSSGSSSNTNTCDSTSADSATSNTNTTCNANDKNNSSRDVAIGVGVGVPLGVLACTGLAWALFERKKRYSLLNSPQAMVAAAQPYPMAPPPMAKPPQELGQ